MVRKFTINLSQQSNTFIILCREHLKICIKKTQIFIFIIEGDEIFIQRGIFLPLNDIPTSFRFCYNPNPPLACV